MQEDARLRFQGKCLQSMEGRMFMPSYDEMPPAVRARLQQSPFNLCAACVRDYSYKGDKQDYMAAIEMMEEQIRAGD